jgi:hypothetical protein
MTIERFHLLNERYEGGIVFDINAVDPTPCKIGDRYRIDRRPHRDLETERWNVTQNQANLMFSNKISFSLNEARYAVMQ